MALTIDERRIAAERAAEWPAGNGLNWMRPAEPDGPCELQKPVKDPAYLAALLWRRPALAAYG